MWAIIIIVIGVVLIIGAISSNSDEIKKAKAREEFLTSAQGRRDAYASYLRRTSSDASIQAMPDHELNDFVMNNIKSYKGDCDTRDQIGALIFFGGAAVSMLIVASDGWNWVTFIALCVLAFAAAALFVKKQDKTITDKYKSLGLEIERLEVKL